MSGKYIPKIIHYCWFGGKPLPKLAQRCIESWRKYCPDYEIVRWDETNFELKCCDYIREAYAEKKWAFVSDYARFWLLYHYGGVYFDTDVELIKPIDDIVSRGPFMGLEAGTREMPAPGLGIAAYPKMEIFHEILDYYSLLHFKREPDGTYKTVVTITKEILMRHGVIDGDSISNICGLYIYPIDYFCPLNYYTGELNLTSNSRSVHHYAATWLSWESREMVDIRKRIAGRGIVVRLLGIFTITILHMINVVKRKEICNLIVRNIKRVRRGT